MFLGNRLLFWHAAEVCAGKNAAILSVNVLWERRWRNGAIHPGAGAAGASLALGLLAALLVGGIGAAVMGRRRVLSLALRTLGAMALTAAALLLGGLLCRR